MFQAPQFFGLALPIKPWLGEVFELQGALLSVSREARVASVHLWLSAQSGRRPLRSKESHCES